MVKLLFRLLVIIFLVGIVYMATNNSTVVRERLMGAKSAVAGVSTSAETLENSLPTELKEDTQEQIQNLQKSVFEVKVGEIFSFFSRAGKIIDDFHTLQEDVSKELHDKEK